MTKKQYVRRAAHRLHLPRGMKRAVLDGLAESFESAREHGETEGDVIARLGSPKAFAREALQSAEWTEFQRSCIRRERSLRIAVIVCAVFILVMGGGLTVRAVAEAAFRQTVIGYADGPTQIFVAGGFAPLLPLVFLAILAVACLVLILCWFHVKKQLEDE